MDTAGAKRTVLVSSMALILIALYRDRTAPDEVAFFRRVWGVGVLSIMLATAADFVPRIAGPFALLTVLGAMTQGGDKAFVNALSNLGQPATGSANTAGTAPAPSARDNAASGKGGGFTGAGTAGSSTTPAGGTSGGGGGGGAF